jgi:hypothetical protein
MKDTLLIVHKKENNYMIIVLDAPLAPLSLMAFGATIIDGV